MARGERAGGGRRLARCFGQKKCDIQCAHTVGGGKEEKERCHARVEGGDGVRFRFFPPSVWVRLPLKGRPQQRCENVPELQMAWRCYWVYDWHSLHCTSYTVLFGELLPTL